MKWGRRGNSLRSDRAKVIPVDQSIHDESQLPPVPIFKEFATDKWLGKVSRIGLLVVPMVFLGILVTLELALNRSGHLPVAGDAPWLWYPMLVVGGCCVGIVFWIYLCIISKRPQWLLYLMLAAWPVIEWSNNYLLSERGVNVHLRPILLLIIGTPAIWLLCCNGKRMFVQVHCFKYLFVFCAWLALYFSAFNAEKLNPGLEKDAIYVNSSHQVAYSLYALFGTIIASCSMSTGAERNAAFDRVNYAILGASVISSVIAIGGAAKGYFLMEVDGVTRLAGIFTHPNPFAHHQGILLVYFLGLYYYYSVAEHRVLRSLVVLLAIALNGVALALAFSKSAILALALAWALFCFLSIFSQRGRIWLAKSTALASVALLMVWTLSSLAGGPFYEDVVRPRMQNRESMEWRKEAWEYVKRDITVESLKWGNGLASVNYRMYEFSDRQIERPLVMVHNAYIALLHDLGVSGYLLFAAALSMIWQAFRLFIRASGRRTGLPAVAIAMMCYFLVVCSVDEIASMFDASVIVWTLGVFSLARAINIDEHGTA